MTSPNNVHPHTSQAPRVTNHYQFRPYSYRPADDQSATLRAEFAAALREANEDTASCQSPNVEPEIGDSSEYAD